MISQVLINVRLALASLRASKLRSFLTMIAVIIGVGSFLVVTTTVEGLKSTAASEINELGGNLVTINSGKLFIEDDEGNQTLNFAAAAGASTLTEQDLADVREVEGVKAAAPQTLISGQVSRGEEEAQGTLIIGTGEDYPAAFNQTVDVGEFLSDEDAGKSFVVVGQGVVEDLYGGELTLGTKIQIRGEQFTVIGAMDEVESSFSFGPDLNNAVFISLETAKDLTGGPVLIQEIDIQLEDASVADAAVAEMERILLENHGGEEDFTVLKQDELINLTSNLFDSIKGAAQYLSGIMLFVAAVVILLIMLITVTERTHEIGIRKSIGATNSNIMVQFLTEAIVISWVGSLLGLLFGFGLGFLVKNATDITPSYTANTLFVVVLISTFVGTIAGAYPAWQAARKDPVEALRHE